MLLQLLNCQGTSCQKFVGKTWNAFPCVSQSQLTVSYTVDSAKAENQNKENIVEEPRTC